MEGRLVVLFKRRPGADRRLGTDRSKSGEEQGHWEVGAQTSGRSRVGQGEAQGARSVRVPRRPHGLNSQKKTFRNLETNHPALARN